MTDLNKALGEARPTLLEVYDSKKKCCREDVPVVDELKAALGESANVLARDGSRYPALADEYNIESYPCWLLFKDGKVVWRDYGQKSVGELERLVRDFV